MVTDTKTEEELERCGVGQGVSITGRCVATIDDDDGEADALPGDCAELFDYCEEKSIESKIKLLLQMSLVLIWGLSLSSFSCLIPTMSC